MTFDIKINSSEDAQALNAIATKIPVDIWIHGKQGTADAKSLLGLMLMSMEREVKLVVDDAADEKRIRKEFRDFIIE
ncbi:MAG: HPr family phosphocarrier protein [Oscillospiraceae bacterium]|nr:HPr family phosphocarrier protein [Oscillospiraceae bacterium]